MKLQDTATVLTWDEDKRAAYIDMLEMNITSACKRCGTLRKLIKEEQADPESGWLQEFSEELAAKNARITDYTDRLKALGAYA